jgi:hypothetical protein
MEKNVVKTYKPVIGGILNIVSGACCIFAVLGLIIAILVIHYGAGWGMDYYPMEAGFVEGILVIIAVYQFIVGVLSLAGGIVALGRRMWGLSLAGSIAAVLGVFPLGVAAIILIATSKEEFST